MKVELTNITPNAELHCEKAARDCYDSIDKMKDPTKTTGLLKSCTIADHLTINGHASATFRVSGVSRALMGQITRHRTACFSIRSQRYVNEENFEYVTPPSIKDNMVADALYQKLMSDLNNGYKSLLDAGVKKEDARMILPQACSTVINMTMSFEGWLHYLRRRLAKNAQWEIRELAFQQYKLLNEQCPNIFNKDTILAVKKPNIDETLL